LVKKLGKILKIRKILQKIWKNSFEKKIGNSEKYQIFGKIKKILKNTPENLGEELGKILRIRKNTPKNQDTGVKIIFTNYG